MSSNLGVVFKPLYTGVRDADLIIMANGGINLEVIHYRVLLKGEGVGGTPLLTTPDSSAGEDNNTESPLNSPSNTASAPDTEGVDDVNNDAWVWGLLLVSILGLFLAEHWWSKQKR